jgi:DNA-binding CsgD family transcriptional regulator
MRTLSLSDFLLELYRLTGRGPSLEFSRQSFDLLQTMLPFDSGLWGTFTRTLDGPRPHWAYVHGLPPQMLEEYERVKQYDVVNQRAVANSGRTLNVSLKEAEPAAHPSIVNHARRWGMEHTLATMFLELPLNLFTALCLYRNDPGRPFSEEERQFNEAIVPHLVQAWHLNAVQFLDAPASPASSVPRARAVVDRYGVLYNVEPALPALLRRELPAWQGPSLPKELLPALEHRDSEHRSGQLLMSIVRELPDQMYLVSVRARAPIDALSPRELMVAREFASGKTHKEIAKLFGTSPTTVRTQLRIIYTKLDVRTKVDLVRQVQQRSS